MNRDNALKKLQYAASFLCLFLATTIYSQPDKQPQPGILPDKPGKELKFNTLINPYKLNDHTTFLDLIFNPLFNGLEIRSNGMLKTKYYIANELTPAPEIYDSVIAGTADMGFNVVWRHETDRYPVSSLFKVPRVDKFTYKPAHVTWRMLNEFPEMQKEWEDVKVLFMFVENNGGIATISKPIHSASDLKGLKIICQSERWVTRQVEALGAIPVHANSIEHMKSLLSTAAADGMVYDLPGFLVGYRFINLLKYTVNLPLAPNFLYTVMNKEVWNSLTQEEQQAVNDVFNHDAYVRSDNALVTMDTEYYRRLEDEFGVNRVLLSEKEKTRAAALLQPVRDEYAAFLDAKGYKGKDLMQRFDRLYLQYVN